MAKAVSYTKLKNTLDKLDAQLTASETHGLLTGMLSLRKPVNEEAWRNALLENLDCSKPTKGQWSVLNDTTAQITDALNSADFEFQLLLPKDSEPLSDRLEAIGSWCRGYLVGLGLVGVTEQELAHDVVKELIQDLSQIAHISTNTDDSEEDERNYMELVEYVRVAVQNIKLELRSVDNPKKIH